MPRTPFDQFAKALVIEHLSPYGTTVAEYEVSSEPQYADLWWSPDAQRLPKRPRDVLDRMARTASLWEFFHQPPGEESMLDCLRKLLAHHQQRVRSGATEREPASMTPLWILSAGAPKGAMRAFPFERMAAWPEGFYSGGPFGALRLVVLSSLPRARDTLLLRLLGAGVTLRRAVDELSALPDSAAERIMASPLLQRIELTGLDPSAPEEFRMDFSKKTFEQIDKIVKEQQALLRKQALAEGIEKGIEKGVEQGIERGVAKGIEQGIEPMLLFFANKLGRPLTKEERATAAAKVAKLSPERVSKAFAYDAPALARWLAKTPAR